MFSTCPQCGYTHPVRKPPIAYTVYYKMSLTWDGKIIESAHPFTDVHGATHSIFMGAAGYTYESASILLRYWNSPNDVYSLAPFTDIERVAFRERNKGRVRSAK